MINVIEHEGKCNTLLLNAEDIVEMEEFVRRFPGTKTSPYAVIRLKMRDGKEYVVVDTCRTIRRNVERDQKEFLEKQVGKKTKKLSVR